MSSAPTQQLLVIGGGAASASLLWHLARSGAEPQTLLLEEGRGPGGRCATRRSAELPEIAVSHGCSTFELTQPSLNELRSWLLQEAWIRPAEEGWASWSEREGLGLETPPEELFRGQLGANDLVRGLLQPALRGGWLQARWGARVSQLDFREGLWEARDQAGDVLGRARRLVLSSDRPAHPRWRQSTGQAPPLCRAAQQLSSPPLERALDQLAALGRRPAGSLMMALSEAAASDWRALPWRQLRLPDHPHLSRLELQDRGEGPLVMVLRVREEFAARHLQVAGRGGSAALHGDATARSERERLVEELMQDARGLASSLGLSLAEDSLCWGPRWMRWSAAFPEGEGLAPSLQWLPELSLGFCGDYVAGEDMGSVQGAIRSGAALAARCLRDGLSPSRDR